MRKLIKIIGIWVLSLIVVSGITFFITVWSFVTPIVQDGFGGIVNVSFGLENTTIKVNDTITFNASKSSFSGYSYDKFTGYIKDIPSLFLWDFDFTDGFQVDAVGVTVNHTYTSIGNYTVTLLIVIHPSFDGASNVRFTTWNQINITVVVE